jgi:hypothetical protein
MLQTDVAPQLVLMGDAVPDGDSMLLCVRALGWLGRRKGGGTGSRGRSTGAGGPAGHLGPPRSPGGEVRPPAFVCQENADPVAVSEDLGRTQTLVADYGTLARNQRRPWPAVTDG